MNIVESAILKKEFTQLLQGKQDYALICPYADVPTDATQVFGLIRNHFEKKQDDSIWSSFGDSLIEMCEESESCWLAWYYIIPYLSYSQASGQQFIDIKEVLHTMILRTKEHEEELKQNKKWGGDQYENGLWDDIKRLIRNTQEMFDIQIEVI